MQILYLCILIEIYMSSIAHSGSPPHTVPNLEPEKILFGLKARPWKWELSHWTAVESGTSLLHVCVVGILRASSPSLDSLPCLFFPPAVRVLIFFLLRTPRRRRDFDSGISFPNPQIRNLEAESPVYWNKSLSDCKPPAVYTNKCTRVVG